MSRLQEAEHRRLEVAALGFHWCEAEGRWESPQGISLSDYEIDHLEPWPAYLRRWAQGGRMERWRRSGREQFTVPGRLAAAAGMGNITGIASVFGSPVKTWVETVVERGAFTKSLQQRPQVSVLWQHSSEDPIGVTTRLEETARGLEFSAQLAIEDPQVRGYYHRMQLGAAKGVSIGFDPVKSWLEERRDLGPLRHLEEAELMELSVVTFPADAAAQLTEVQSRRRGGRTAHNLAQLREAELLSAERLAVGDRRYVGTVSKTAAQRADELALAEMMAKSPYAVAESRPSPEREYARYLQQVRAQGRQIFPDGRFIPVSADEAAYAGRLFAQIQQRRRAADNRREQALYEAGCQLFRVAAHQALDIKYAC